METTTADAIEVPPRNLSTLLHIYIYISKRYYLSMLRAQVYNCSFAILFFLIHTTSVLCFNINTEFLALRQINISFSQL